MTGREQIRFSEVTTQRWQGPLRSTFSEELVTTIWIDQHHPFGGMPALVRRKAFYLKYNQVEVIEKSSAVTLIRVPRWFVEENGLKIIEDEREPEYEI